MAAATLTAGASAEAVATEGLCLSARAGLGHGGAMPFVGLGTFMMSEAEAKAATLEAIKKGYRHIDTAEGYKNEAAVGSAILESGVPRSELFITTKLWPGNPDWSQPVKLREEVLDACRQSLDRLQTSYVDLYLVHAPFAGPGKRLEQWRALLELREQGLCRAIGVSNFGVPHLEEIREAGLPLPAANQLELHPYCGHADLLRYMRQHGILPIAYSSLAPLAGWRSAPTDWANGKTEEQKARGETRPFASLAAAHGVSEAQVLLRWALQRGFPVLPKSTKHDRLAENIDLFGFQLSAAEMDELDAMDVQTPMAWNDGLDPTSAP